MTNAAVAAPSFKPLAVEAPMLTLRDCRMILERLPKGHPARKVAFRNIQVYATYARECARQAVGLWRTGRPVSEQLTVVA